jgi:hypothetical protein|tara:strand:+ start:2972 stop:3574 length:603 start_codon:yes stop_codon:yes gene_type:complete
MGFKEYTPPETLPKTIRKGMTMAKFPLWAWPIFSAGLYYEDDELKEVKAVHARTRAKVVGEMNSILWRYSEDISEADTWEDLFDLSYRVASRAQKFRLMQEPRQSWQLAQVLFSSQLPRSRSSYRHGEVLQVVSTKRQGKVLYIVWGSSDGEMSPFYVQKIEGKKSYVIGADADDGQESFRTYLDIIQDVFPLIDTASYI